MLHNGKVFVLAASAALLISTALPAAAIDISVGGTNVSTSTGAQGSVSTGLFGGTNASFDLFGTNANSASAHADTGALGGTTADINLILGLDDTTTGNAHVGAGAFGGTSADANLALGLGLDGLPGAPGGPGGPGGGAGGIGASGGAGGGAALTVSDVQLAVNKCRQILGNPGMYDSGFVAICKRLMRL